MMTDDDDKGKFLVYAIFSSLNVALIDNFTESSPTFPLQRQASYDHQSLPLETEGHSLQSPHNWILETEVKPMNKQKRYLNYSILLY